MKQVVNGKTIYTVYSSLTGKVSVVDEATTGERFSLIDLGPVSIRRKGDGSAEHTHVDPLGSPAAATSAAGVVALRAFVAFIRSTGSNDLPTADRLEGRESYNPYGEKRIDPAANRDRPG